MSIDNQTPDTNQPSEDRISEDYRRSQMEALLAQERAGGAQAAAEQNKNDREKQLEELGAKTFKEYRWTLPTNLFNGWRVERTIRALETQEAKIRQLESECNAKLAHYDKQLAEGAKRVTEVKGTLFDLQERKRIAEATLDSSQASPEELHMARKILGTIDFELQTAEDNLEMALNFIQGDQDRLRSFATILKEAYNYKVSSLRHQQSKSELHYTLLSDKRRDSKKLQDRLFLRNLGSLQLLEEVAKGQMDNKTAEEQAAPTQAAPEQTPAAEPQPVATEPEDNPAPDDTNWAEMVDIKGSIKAQGKDTDPTQSFIIKHPILGGELTVDSDIVEAIRIAYKNDTLTPGERNKLVATYAEGLADEYWQGKNAEEERKNATISMLLRALRLGSITQKPKDTQSSNPTP